MTNETTCALASKCKRAGQTQFCNNLCFPYVRLYGESGSGGVIGVASVPKAYRTSRASNLPFEVTNPQAYKFIRLYIKAVVEKVDEGVGLYLFSIPNESNRKGTGTGKTTAATAILNEYLAERVIMEAKKARTIEDVPGLFVNVSKFQNVYNAQFRGTPEMQAQASETYYRLKARMMNVPLLVMDDIGIREATEAFKNEIYEVIDERASELLATVFTSNVPIERLGTYSLPFVGEDKRKKGL